MRQEGIWIDEFPGVVVYVPGHVLCFFKEQGIWQSSCETTLEPPSVSNLTLLNQVHAPTLKLEFADVRSLRVPYRVPYSVSAGWLAGRMGELVVNRDSEIEDRVTAMS
jgi:hypothetical protein